MAEKGREEDDPELDELLSDALDDFGKTIPPSRDTLPPPQDDITDGLASEMESCLHEATQLLSDHNPELMKEFEKLFSQAASAGMFPQQPSTAQASQSNASIEDTLEQTFQQMKQNKPQKFDMETLNEMFSEVNLSPSASGDLGNDDDDMLSMMQSMMESLLSRDVLYPSLQAICHKYPQWIDEHKDTLSSSDLGRYNNQLDIMRRICDQFELPEPSSDDEKLANQKRILDLMQQLQQYGQPPPELADNMVLTILMLLW